MTPLGWSGTTIKEMETRKEAKSAMPGREDMPPTGHAEGIDALTDLLAEISAGPLRL
jgi:hypothetical protein